MESIDILSFNAALDAARAHARAAHQAATFDEMDTERDKAVKALDDAMAALSVPSAPLATYASALIDAYAKVNK